jgi:GAF domain-containing protein
MFFLGWIAITALIVSPLAGWIATGASLLSLAITGWLFIGGYLAPWSQDTTIGDAGTWAQIGAYILLLSLMIVRGIGLVQSDFKKAQNTADTVFQALRVEQAGLADRIASATFELGQRSRELETANTSNARRASQFEVIAQITNSIASLRSMEDLLPQIADVISGQFGFYHVGIFLNDANNDYAVLLAANSQGGQRMLSRHHQLKIGEQGIVGYVIAKKQARIALDVGNDAMFFKNPDLPETRSEMALPLQIGDRAIGALDIQSVEPQAFDQEDIRVLSILANQVSLAIENARLFEQTKRSLAEAEAVYRQVLREGWSQVSTEEKIAGFRYTAKGVAPIKTRGESSKMKNEQKKQTQLQIPIMLRGETIGTLAIELSDQKQLSSDKMDIISAVVERVALAAENARLFDETSRRAYRERMVSEITTKVRSTNDPQAMLETALKELQKVLGTDKIRVTPYKSSVSRKVNSRKDGLLPS